MNDEEFMKLRVETTKKIRHNMPKIIKIEKNIDKLDKKLSNAGKGQQHVFLFKILKEYEDILPLLQPRMKLLKDGSPQVYMNCINLFATYKVGKDNCIKYINNTDMDQEQYYNVFIPAVKQCQLYLIYIYSALVIGGKVDKAWDDINKLHQKRMSNSEVLDLKA